MIRKTSIRTVLTALLAVPGLALATVAAVPANATTTAAAQTPTWHVDYRQPGMDITAITATGRDNAWAIGLNRRHGLAGLLLHWNGAQWRTMSFPGESAFLPAAIFVLSATDVWLFGEDAMPPYLALHWQHGEWSELKLPAGAQPMAVLSDNDIWVQGGNLPDCDSGSDSDRGCTATSHWNGTSWATYPLAAQTIVSVSASSPSDIWLVGESYARTKPAPHHNGLIITTLPFVFRWAGTGWQRSRLTVRRTSGTPSIVADSAKDVFVAEASTNHWSACAMHWDGRKWTPFYLPGSPGACDWTVSDYHGGLWFAGTLGSGFDFVHWTGERFVTTTRFSPSPSFNTNGFLLTAVPHTSVAWLFGSYCRLPGACHDMGLIAELR
jgi:hypothetical protein